jgi:hypothetical protein
MPRLRRVNHQCSRTLSDTANMSRHGSTLCSPTIEKLLCRSPIFEAVTCRQSAPDPQGKGEKIRGWKPQVSTLLCPRRVGALPAEAQRKTSRPLGANTPAAVRVPRSAGAKKKPPVRGEHAYAVRIPRSAGAEKTACAVRIPSVALYRENEKGTAHAVPLPSTDMSVAQQQQLPQLPQPPQVLSPQVPQEPQPPLP